MKKFLIVWAAIWAVVIVGISAYSLNEDLPKVAGSLSVLALGVLCHNILKELDLTSNFEKVMAIDAIAFMGTMCTALVGCMYSFEISMQLDTFIQWMIRWWFLTIAIGLIATLCFQWKQMGGWRIPILILAILVIWMIVVSFNPVI